LVLKPALGADDLKIEFLCSIEAPFFIRPGFCEGVARSRGQDWPQATAEGARKAVLTAASTAARLGRVFAGARAD
jgi:hypothetical protein